MLQFRQLNGCETSHSYDSKRLNILFVQGVGEPTCNEYEISLALARLFPDYVPTIIATRPEWMVGYGRFRRGISERTVALLQTAICRKSLGKLQVESIA